MQRLWIVGAFVIALACLLCAIKSNGHTYSSIMVDKALKPKLLSVEESNAVDESTLPMTVTKMRLSLSGDPVPGAAAQVTPDAASRAQPPKQEDVDPLAILSQNSSGIAGASLSRPTKGVKPPYSDVTNGQVGRLSTGRIKDGTDFAGPEIGRAHV